jgi:hypothetical protein
MTALWAWRSAPTARGLGEGGPDDLSRRGAESAEKTISGFSSAPSAPQGPSAPGAVLDPTVLRLHEPENRGCRTGAHRESRGYKVWERSIRGLVRAHLGSTTKRRRARQRSADCQSAVSPTGSRPSARNKRRLRIATPSRHGGSILAVCATVVLARCARLVMPAAFPSKSSLR